MTRTQTVRPGIIGGVATKLRDILTGGGAEGTTQPPLETVPDKPTREQVIAAIVAETHCKPGQASSTLNWIQGFVNRCRQTAYATQYPTSQQMQTLEYRIFDKIMPHAKAPEPGSAADQVNQLILDPAKGETSLWHDQESRYSSVYCSVKVSLVAVR